MTKITTVKNSNSAKNSSSDLNFSLGSKLFDRYEIFRIFKGGIGLILIVEDANTGKYYAVKTFQISRENAVNSLINEIYLWFMLPPHKHIVQPYFIEFIDSQPLLFMEYIPGKTDPSLRSLIGKASVNHSVEIAYQICLAMEFVNKQKPQIVHADLKPENILVTEDGIIKVTDFGTAKLIDFYNASFPVQRSGSLPYMSQEQLQGKNVDERSDIFSFGVIFYELITGYLPYPFLQENLNSQTWRMLLENFYSGLKGKQKHDYYPETPWRQIKSQSIDDWPKLDQLILTCLVPDPYDRWRSFSQLRQYFEIWLGDKLDFEPLNQEESIKYSYSHRKALALHKIGRLDESLQAFNSAISENPNNALIWRDAAISLLDAHQTEVARQFIEQAKNLYPSIDICDSRLKKLFT